MNKIIGGFAILISSLILSYIPLYQSKQRIRLLRDLIHDLYYIHNELQTNLSSIPCIIDFMCEYGSLNTQSFYQALKTDLDRHTVAMFSRQWTNRLKYYENELLPEELRTLSHLGNILGKYTLEEQLSYIENTICLLEKGADSTKTEYFTKKNFYIGVGGSIGMTLVILLV